MDIVVGLVREFGLGNALLIVGLFVLMISAPAFITTYRTRTKVRQESQQTSNQTHAKMDDIAMKMLARNEELQARFDAQQQKYQESNMQLMTLFDENTTLTNSVQDLRDMVQRLESDLTKVRAERDTERTLVGNLKNQLENMRNENENLLTEIKNRDKTIANLEERIQQLESNKSRLEQRIQQLEKEKP